MLRRHFLKTIIGTVMGGGLSVTSVRRAHGESMGMEGQGEHPMDSTAISQRPGLTRRSRFHLHLHYREDRWAGFAPSTFHILDTKWTETSRFSP